MAISICNVNMNCQQWNCKNNFVLLMYDLLFGCYFSSRCFVTLLPLGTTVLHPLNLVSCFKLSETHTILIDFRMMSDPYKPYFSVSHEGDNDSYCSKVSIHQLSSLLTVQLNERNY